MAVSININTKSRSDMIDITAAVAEEVLKSGISEGICTIYVPHTTAGITINEGADPAVCRDILHSLEKLVPPGAGYRHMEGNADSHIKTSIMGSSVSILVEKSRLLLGTWQKIFFCEFDGPRSRKFHMKVLGR